VSRNQVTKGKQDIVYLMHVLNASAAMTGLEKRVCLALSAMTHTTDTIFVIITLKVAQEMRTRWLQEYYKSVTRDEDKMVTRVLQECYKSATRVLQEMRAVRELQVLEHDFRREQGSRLTHRLTLTFTITQRDTHKQAQI
jgi:hypothetical protein